MRPVIFLRRRKPPVFLLPVEQPEDIFLFFPDERMADQELSEILCEYQNLAESEHQSFVASLLHSQNFAATVFSALQIYEVGQFGTGLQIRKFSDDELYPCKRARFLPLGHFCTPHWRC